VIVLVQALALAAAFVSETVGTVAMVVTAVAGLAGLVSIVAVSVRRWHDLDKSGWWVLIGFVPVVGLYALVMNGFVQGAPGSNGYGLAPVGLPAARASQPV
jgi:uncharacterized membrane protein YhaH (DUF805 family)